jgi:cytochrome c553
MSCAANPGRSSKRSPVHTDKGHKVLMVKSTIPPPSADPPDGYESRPQSTDRASGPAGGVQGRLRPCHVEPVIGKMGKELFTAACGICHEAEHRASMVPDLHQLKVTPNAEYWKFYIVNGKPATLMPAFAQAQGGPLSDAQIASLVEYMVKDFPATKTNAPAAPVRTEASGRRAQR